MSGSLSLRTQRTPHSQAQSESCYYVNLKVGLRQAEASSCHRTFLIAPKVFGSPERYFLSLVYSFSLWLIARGRMSKLDCLKYFVRVIGFIVGSVASAAAERIGLYLPGRKLN